jgi:hypothetical protein
MSHPSVAYVLSLSGRMPLGVFTVSSASTLPVWSNGKKTLAPFAGSLDQNQSAF